tara:strand:- start:35 stop:397 length:363 start_codon:yes stop_codon:yes gene_type:complete
MTDEKKTTEVWTIDELVSLTEEIQSIDLEYNGKNLPIQWCELTEAEEPKLSMASDDVSEEEKQAHYAKLASNRVLAMISKANDKNPDGKVLDADVWDKLPTTLRWRISNTLLQTSDTENL